MVPAGVAFLIVGGSFLYGLFDRWLGRYRLYRLVRWAVLSFWLRRPNHSSRPTGPCAAEAGW